MQQPLPSIANPLDVLRTFGIHAPTTSITLWALGIVVFCWIIYTLIAGYHWFRYSHASWVAYPSLAVHLLVSATLILFAVSGLVL